VTVEILRNTWVPGREEFDREVRLYCGGTVMASSAWGEREFWS